MAGEIQATAHRCMCRDCGPCGCGKGADGHCATCADRPQTTGRKPHWRNSKFGGNIEFVRVNRWLGTVGPEIGGECRYSSASGGGVAPTQDEAKRRVEMEAATDA